MHKGLEINMMKRGLKLKGFMRAYLGIPLFLSILFLIMGIQVFLMNRKAGYLCGVYFLIYIMASSFIYFGSRRKIRRDLINFASNYGQMQVSIIKEMDIPYCVLNEEGQLLWGNDKFLEVIVNKKAARKGINNVFPEITYGKLPKTPEGREIHVQAQERYYRCVLNLVVNDSVANSDETLHFDQIIENKRIIAMCMYEETEVINLEKVRDAENLVVGLLYIDNYEELIESIDEVRQSLTVALIDRKVNKYMQGIDAISKKLEKDKFFFAFKQKHLER